MWLVYKDHWGTRLYYTGSDFVKGRENALQMTLEEASRVAGNTWGLMERV